MYPCCPARWWLCSNHTVWRRQFVWRKNLFYKGRLSPSVGAGKSLFTLSLPLSFPFPFPSLLLPSLPSFHPLPFGFGKVWSGERSLTQRLRVQSGRQYNRCILVLNCHIWGRASAANDAGGILYQVNHMLRELFLYCAWKKFTVVEPEWYSRLQDYKHGMTQIRLNRPIACRANLAVCTSSLKHKRKNIPSLWSWNPPPAKNYPVLWRHPVIYYQYEFFIQLFEQNTSYTQAVISVDPGGGKGNDRPSRIFRMGRDVYVRPPPRFWTQYCCFA